MAGRHAADRDPGGGERIPPARARARSRLALALAALAIAAGVAVYGTLEADKLALLVLALGAGSVALLAFGLAVPSPPALVGSFVGIAASWSLSAWTRGSGAPGGTILAAAGIFVAAELAYWSLEERGTIGTDPGESLRHVGVVTLLALGGLVAGSALLAVADIARTDGVAVDLLGATAAAGALLVVVLHARRAG